MLMHLREVRQRKLVTQQELAETTGLTEATISRIENGQTTPRISTIRKLAKALKVDPDELVTWKEESPDVKEAADA